MTLLTDRFVAKFYRLEERQRGCPVGPGHRCSVHTIMTYVSKHMCLSKAGGDFMPIW